MFTSRTTPIFGLLLLLILLAPLPFASVLPWAWTSLAAAVAVLTAAWSVQLFVARQRPPVPVGRMALPVFLLGATVLWVMIQISPWTPAVWHHPIWNEASTVLGTPIPGRISVDPHQSGAALLRLLSYAAIFWLALQFGRDRKTARLAVTGVAVAGAVYAAYGLIVFFSGNETVLWVRKTAYADSVTSTFINRNSYATYAGIGLICGTALITRLILNLRSHPAVRRERLRIVMSELLGRGWLLILIWIVIATALFLTNSRAGVISSLVGLVFFLGSLGLSPNIPSGLARLMAAIILVAGGIFFWISGDTVTERLFGQSVHSDGRLALYQMTLQAISDSPVLGMGYGTFDQVFDLYRGDTPEFRQRSVKAHSTYLENIMELGIPAATALFLAVACPAWICFRGIRRRRRDIIYPATGLAITALVAVHSMVDFSLQNPAVASTYSFLLGLACAQSWGSGAFLERRARPGGAGSP